MRGWEALRTGGRVLPVRAACLWGALGFPTQNLG